jgi:arylsulfatase A-like enzyme
MIISMPPIRPLLTLIIALLVTPIARTAPPNIVLIVADDLGWTGLACSGSDYHETPNLDRFAKQGMTFTSAYANAPNCAPTRACLLTGLYSPRHGIYTVGDAARGKAKRRRLIPVDNKTVLPAEAVTIAEVLGDNGYATAHMGKWHLGSDVATSPTGQGFDLNIAGGSAGQPPTYFSPYGLPDLADGAPGENLTERLGKEAERFIEGHTKRHPDQPFFLYLPFYAVHTPIEAKSGLTAKYEAKQTGKHHKNAKYAAMIETMDASVGKVLTTLDRLDLAANTLVVFFADNGGHGRITTQAPLRGAKGMLYEGGIREPLIVRWPGVIQAGTMCDVPVIGIDFFPTFLDVATASQSRPSLLDGVSLLPLLKGANSLKRDAIHWHFPAYLEGKNYDGARDKRFRTRPAAAIRVGDWKLIEYFEDNALALYNLASDLGESTNLAEKHPDTVKKLHARMRVWRKQTGAFVPGELNPKYRPPDLKSD